VIFGRGRLSPPRPRAGRRATVAECFSSRDNAFGVLRLALASAVLVSHSYPLSGRPDRDPLARFSGGQVSLGTLAVLGFFVISGFLVTRSALRTSFRSYAWRRFLRIFPGFWACLVVTAFVFAPLMWLYERGFHGGFLESRPGPLGYVGRNVAIGMNQNDIGGLMRGTPYGLQVHAGYFDGSLWTLVYEVGCYVFVGGLVAVAVRRWARISVPVVAALLLVPAVVFRLVPQHAHLLAKPPIIGLIDSYWIVTLGFAFALGALIEVFKERIPVHDGLGLLSLVALLVTLRVGGFAPFGSIALAYAVIWLAVRLPRAMRGIGRRNDYSYGIYIYAFPVQQMLAEVGAGGWWLPLYMGAAFLLTVPLAMLSWHGVESRAMALRDRGRPRWLVAPRRAAFRG
jgi:peptidoglycan/LPS O-acetylase OafA/YrhL